MIENYMVFCRVDQTGAVFSYGKGKCIGSTVMYFNELYVGIIRERGGNTILVKNAENVEWKIEYSDEKYLMEYSTREAAEKQFSTLALVWSKDLIRAIFKRGYQ